MYVYFKMSRSIYYGSNNIQACTYTPPEDQDIHVYLTKLLGILTTFKTTFNKDLTLKSLETMKEILNLVKLKNTSTG